MFLRVANGQTGLISVGFRLSNVPTTDKHPYRDEKSRFCCGVADTVKTKFKVEPGNEKYPEDRWYAWFKEEWILIPPEKIVQDYSPDGQPYLFMLADTVQCFVRPKGGL
jgi:hypothetical protein